MSDCPLPEPIAASRLQSGALIAVRQVGGRGGRGIGFLLTHVRRSDMLASLLFCGIRQERGRLQMARAKPLAIAVVVLVSLTAAFVARAGNPVSKPRASGPPPYVAKCLALAPQERGDCFRANSSAQPRAGVPARIAACLALPAGPQRASCFRNLTPAAVAGCLALQTRTERAACFRQLVPARIAACLAQPTRQQRTSCFKKLRRRP
jgi:hypothetical protein